MSKPVITEALRKAAQPLPGSTPVRQGMGQKRSLERGVQTRSKKNPGKRPHAG